MYCNINIIINNKFWIRLILEINRKVDIHKNSTWSLFIKLPDRDRAISLYLRLAYFTLTAYNLIDKSQLIFLHTNFYVYLRFFRVDFSKISHKYINILHILEVITLKDLFVYIYFLNFILFYIIIVVFDF